MTSKSIGIDGGASCGGVAEGGTAAPGAAVCRRLLLKAAAAGTLVAASGAAFPVEALASGGHSGRRALWQIARRRGLVWVGGPRRRAADWRSRRR